MPRLQIGLLVCALITLSVNAQPPPCYQSPTPQPSHFTFTYLGNVSGCTQNGGACLPGETIQFTAVHLVDYSQCPFIGYSWNFGDGTPLDGGTTTGLTHVFSVPGSFSVQLTVVVAANSTAVTKPVVVAAASIPTLQQLVGAALIMSLGIIAVIKLR